MKRNMLAVVFVGVLCFSTILDASHSLYENAQNVYTRLHPDLQESILRKDMQSLFAGAFIVPATQKTYAIKLNNGMDRAYCVQMSKALQRLQKKISEGKKYRFFDSIKRMKLSPDVEFQERFLEYYCTEHADATVKSVAQDIYNVYMTVLAMDSLPYRVATQFQVPAVLHIAIFGILHRSLEDLYNKTYSASGHPAKSATQKKRNRWGFNSLRR